jgi:hypothetical protein
MLEAWKIYIDSLEKSLKNLEKDVGEAACVTSTCTGEWCVAVEHVVDEISNALYSISEPSVASEEDNRKIKDLKLRVRNLYAKYKSIPKP